jgi:hypothetical protein
VVGLPDHIQHRTALRRVTVEDAVQILWRECIGQGLRTLPIGDPDKGVVSHGKVDTCGGQLARQPGPRMAWHNNVRRGAEVINAPLITASSSFCVGAAAVGDYLGDPPGHH